MSNTTTMFSLPPTLEYIEKPNGVEIKPFTILRSNNTTTEGTFSIVITENWNNGKSNEHAAPLTSAAFGNGLFCNSISIVVTGIAGHQPLSSVKITIKHGAAVMCEGSITVKNVSKRKNVEEANNSNKRVTPTVPKATATDSTLPSGVLPTSLDKIYGELIQITDKERLECCRTLFDAHYQATINIAEAKVKKMESKSKLYREHLEALLHVLRVRKEAKIAEINSITGYECDEGC